MISKKSLGNSIVKNVKRNSLISVMDNLENKHKDEVEISEELIKERLKYARDSDVPLFSDLDIMGLGMEIKNAYNRCISILTFEPEGIGQHSLNVDTLINEARELMDNLKKAKEDYSGTWKRNYKKVKRDSIETAISYDEKTAINYKWQKHPALKNSEAMEKAAGRYFKVAKTILEKLQEMQVMIEKELGGVATKINLTLDKWEELGRWQVKVKLKKIQAEVDLILAEEWKTYVRPLIKESYPRYKDIKPTYIGSTNTGHKAITKAHIQFYPGKFDVDGQIISNELFEDLADLELPASKNRFFVSQVYEDVEKNLNRLKKTNAKVAARMDGIVELLHHLYMYTQAVYPRLCNEVEGIDTKDEFDIAIIAAPPKDK